MLPPVEEPSDDSFHFDELQQYIYRIVWNYVLLTVILNAVFAWAVFGLMSFLQVDLAAIIAIICFVLSFIPELGAIISAMLPIPFIMLTPTQLCRTDDFDVAANNHTAVAAGASDMDCITDLPERIRNVLASLIGMFIIKLLVSNVLSAFLIGKNKTLAGVVDDQEAENASETHGVIVLFAVVFFGHIWGVVGMLISVPVISMVRLALNMSMRAHSIQKQKLQEHRPDGLVSTELP